MTKRIIFPVITALSILCFINPANAQNGPGPHHQERMHVFVGTGQNQLILPFVDLDFSGIETIEVASTDDHLLEVISADYTAGQSFAMTLVKEKGRIGSVTLTLTVTDMENIHKLAFGVDLVNYDNPGINFEIHDIVFWQESVPLHGMPVFDTIIQTSEGPFPFLNYAAIPITVNLDCANSPPCTGHDFFTAFYRGYIVPPVDGTYHFTMQSNDRHALFLSPNESFPAATRIAARTNNSGNTGTDAGGGRWRSGPQELQAGKVYAIYGVQWIIHTTIGGIMWEGPGIELEFIPGEYMMPVYDLIKPTAPGNLTLDWKAVHEASISWQSSTDNIKLAGYNVYVNGFRHNQIPVQSQHYRFTDLIEDTSYDLVVTAVDGVGNESFASNIISFSTFGTDTIPPNPPDQLEILSATGLAVHVKWSGAADEQSEVIGYNLYVDDVLYNNDEVIFQDQIIIRNLQPNTSYALTIEAVDAGFNVSEMSAVFNVSTGDFDPLGPDLGERQGRFVVHNRNVSWNHGLGLNGPYGNGAMVDHPDVRRLVVDFEAGAIRWGAIDANSKSFHGSVGPGRPNTYGKMMHFANELDAYFALTVGVQQGIDYITDPNTFLYLLEYLAGDSTTTWGAVRASEGFPEPLLQPGRGILLEFGNEVWGGASHQAHIGSNYATYAAWARDMSDVIRSSPYYDPEKIIMVYSGRYPHPGSSFGVNTAVLTGDRGHVECLGVSGYLGGNLNYDPEIPPGDSELDYYKNGIAMARRNMDGFVLNMREMLSLTGSMKTFYLYESNMTTTSYNGRLGQAMVMTDYLASSMLYGSIVPTIFHLTGGQWRITRPTEDYRPLPLYVTGQYFNRFCKGHILETEFQTNSSIHDANGNRVDWEPVGAYTYNNEDRLSLLFINRDFENDFTIQVALPPDLDIPGDAVMYTLWHEDFSSFDIHVDSVSIDLQDGLLIRLPKHAMVVITSAVSDPDFESLPMGYFERKRPDSLDVYFHNTGTIATNRGVESVWAYAYPEDAFSRAVVFEILEDETQSTLTFQSSRVHIRGSGLCEDEGRVVVKVRAADNPELADTMTVFVTNQGTNCGVWVEEVMIDDKPLFYPNPAAERILVNEALDGDSMLEIYDLSGRRIFARLLREGYHVPVGSYREGVYVILVTTPEGRQFRSMMLKQ